MKMDGEDVVWIFVLIIVISFLVSSNVYNYSESKKSEGFDLSSLGTNVGTSLCTASVNSKTLYDDDAGIYLPLYNITQEKMLELVKKYPNGRIEDTTECIGKWITIYK